MRYGMWILALVFIVGIGCGSSQTVTPPTADEIQGAIAAANPDGIVAGQAMNAATLPPCLDSDGNALVGGIYSYGLVEDGTDTIPEWLTFGAQTRVFAMADGYDAVPASAVGETTMGYTCQWEATDRRVTTFTLSVTE